MIIFGILIKYLIMKKLSRNSLKTIKGSGTNSVCSVDIKCPAGYICCNYVCLKAKEIEHLPECNLV